MIDEILKNLEETWGYTSEELIDIRMQLIKYACAVLMDSEVRKELDDIW
jgi:hypothetical protein